MTRKRKGQGVGGALGGIFGGKKKEGERIEEEEAAGAGVPGSPRIVSSMPRTPVVAQPAGGGGGARMGAAGGAVPMATGGPTVTTTRTTVATVPVSTAAASISTATAP